MLILVPHRFTDVHRFAKPNDSRGLELMDHAAVSLMREFPDIVLGFGQSDEYRYPNSTTQLESVLNRRSSISFLLRKSAVLYNRRRSKITSILCSHFTSAYVMHWHTYFPDTPLSYPPSFDARVVLYPGTREVRDYFSWRQADSAFHLPCDRRPAIDRLSAHVNNLYNTVFWALIHKEGQSPKQAHEALRVRSHPIRFLGRSYPS